MLLARVLEEIKTPFDLFASDFRRKWLFKAGDVFTSRKHEFLVGLKKLSHENGIANIRGGAKEAKPTVPEIFHYSPTFNGTPFAYRAPIVMMGHMEFDRDGI